MTPRGGGRAGWRWIPLSELFPPSPAWGVGRYHDTQVAFFKLVHAELHKCADFFSGMEQQMMLRMKRLRQSVAYLKQPNMVVEEEAWTRMRRSCISFYKVSSLASRSAVAGVAMKQRWLKRDGGSVVSPPGQDLLLLENYAVLQFCGFSKALKKHDKNTG